MNNRLSVSRVLLGAFSVIWLRPQEYFHTLAIPTLLVALAWAFSTFLSFRAGSSAGFIALPFYAVAFTVFAITCHRFILARQSDGPNGRRLALGQREVRFLGWLVVVYLIVGVIKGIMLTVMMNAHGVSEGPFAESPRWLMQVATIPAYYVLGRLSLVFPATALDVHTKLVWSWRRTRKDGWRMFVVVGLFPWVIGELLGFVWREEATVVEQSMIALLWLIGLSIQIFALSFSYKELLRHVE